MNTTTPVKTLTQEDAYKAIRCLLIENEGRTDATIEALAAKYDVSVQDIRKELGIGRFPKKIQEEIKGTLKAFRGVYVFRENGTFRTSIGIALTGAKNADDYRCWHILNTDIYTQEQIDEFNKDAPEWF